MYNCITYRWNVGEEWGNWNKCPFSLSSLNIGAVLYITRNKPKWCCCNVWMLPPFSLLFIYFFASHANFCRIYDIKRGAGDRKPWSCKLKLSSLFRRYMIRITVCAKIITTGCQAPKLVTTVWNPNKDAGLAKMSSRANLLSSRRLCSQLVKLKNWRNLWQDLPSCRGK